jgi:ABC-type sugar transport system ATPase subunit
VYPEGTTSPDPGVPVAPSSQTAQVEMRGIRKSYSGVEVLHGVDLTVTRGEVHALVGENGAGKSTLMKILSGDVLPDSGAVVLSTARVSFRSPHDAQAAGISMIQQELSYVGTLSVAENLVLGRLPTRAPGILDRRAMVGHARSLISRAGLDIDVTRKMSTLSQIEKQLVEILKATDRQARLIVMDEPTSSLTSTEVRLLFGIIRQLRAGDVSVIYISHHLDEIFSIADRVTVLRDGNWISTRPVGEVTHDSLVREMVGGVVEASRRDSAPANGPPVCKLTSLTLPGGVSDVSLELRPGEVYALYGLLGAGQERVARALYGLEPDYEGIIEMSGRAVNLRAPRKAIANGVGFVPSDRKAEGIVPQRPVRDNITYPSLKSLSTLGVLRLRAERAVVGRVLSRLRVRGAESQRVGSLSGGNQQKVVVSRWFAHDVRLLVMVDPTRGVDVRAKAEIHRLVGELAGSGVAVLVVSSDLPEIVAIADRVGVVRRGRLVGEYDGSATTAEEVLSVAAGGIPT